MNYCQCGCGSEIPVFSKHSHGNTRQRFKFGHQTRGRYNANYGKHLSCETIEKQRLSHIGRYDGENNPMYGRRGVLAPAYGRPVSDETREKQRLLHLGSNNKQWKGNNIGISQLHIRIRKILPKPKLCSLCLLNPPYELANKTGMYDFNLTNWWYLCRRCHNRSHDKVPGKLLRCGGGIQDPLTGRFVSNQQPTSQGQK